MTGSIMAELILGVDSSTQSTKVEVRDLASGAIVGEGRAPHPATSPPLSEQDPNAWWVALRSAIASLGPLRRNVVAMSVGAQQHGLVTIDAAGAVLRPAKLWNDTTSAPEARDLVTQKGAAWWTLRCGSVPLPAFTVTKVAWMAEHEPGLHARIAKVMLPHDYLTWRLTGAHVTDRGDASGTGWWSSDSYRPEVLELVGLDASVLPRVLGPQEAAGRLTASAAAELGLPERVVVGPGTGDNMAAALGLGLRPGDVTLSLGTSGTIYAVAGRPTHDSTGAVAGFADATGGFLPLVCTLNATKVTDTVASWLGTDAAGLSRMALDAIATADQTFSPILVPYFDGERTPNLPDAAGVFAGLRSTTTREQLALAAHDGVVCGLLDGYDALTAASVAVGGRVHLIGGGARSGAYRQRVADLIGRTVVVSDSDETVATGACVQAAVVHSAMAQSAVVQTGDEFGAVADRWHLGQGNEVSPSGLVDRAARRAQYAAARAWLLD